MPWAPKEKAGSDGERVCTLVGGGLWTTRPAQIMTGRFQGASERECGSKGARERGSEGARERGSEGAREGRESEGEREGER